jgi:hypothetical protein
MAADKTTHSIEKICEQAIAIVREYTFKKPEAIIGIEEAKGEWKVTVEALERKAIPDAQDLLGRYEIRFNENGKLLGWKQTVVRKRVDLIAPAEDK